MRTGSNLLESSLNQFAGITSHGELFNPAFIGKPGRESCLGIDLISRERDPGSLLNEIRVANVGKINGFRIFHDHDPRILNKVLSDPDCARIVLERDPLDAFVSLRIARQTDQWQLRNQSRSRLEKVHFNQQEFDDFLAERTKFADRIRTEIRQNGLTAFWLNYTDLKDLRIINGLAKYLGQSEILPKVRHATLQQNPGAISDRVSNPQDLPAATLPARAPPVDPTALPAIARLILAKDLPLVLAPLNRGLEGGISDWMNAIGPPSAGNTGGNVTTGLGRRDFARWRGTHGKAIMFACLSHPMRRAFSAFQRHILSDGPERFPVIRRQLVQRYGLVLPTVGEATVPETRQAFHQFLLFLERNLSGNTSIRTDQSWASQAALIDGYSRLMPISLIARSEKWHQAATYLAEFLGVDRPHQHAPRGQVETDLDTALAAFVSPETEALLRQAYATDYARYGWVDWTYAA